MMPEMAEDRIVAEIRIWCVSRFNLPIENV